MTSIKNASVASELLNVLINNLHPYYSIFVRLQRKTNNYYIGRYVGKKSNL